MIACLSALHSDSHASANDYAVREIARECKVIIFFPHRLNFGFACVVCDEI
jgi:hypothetical protein